MLRTAPASLYHSRLRNHIKICVYVEAMQNHSDHSGNLPLEALVTALKAAGEPTRLRALALLQQGELSVGELAQILSLSQPRLSQHMKLLTAAGLVERLPEGAWVFYRLAAQGAGLRLLHAVLPILEVQSALIGRDRQRLHDIKEQRREAAEAYFARSAAQWDPIRDSYLPGIQLETEMRNLLADQRFGFMLDLGSGTGRLLAAFADQIDAGEGIDMSHPMLTIARANLETAGIDHIQVRKGDILDLPFIDRSADLVTLQMVLHYLDAPERAIGEALRVTKPGGTLMIADFAPHMHEELRLKHAHRRLGFHDHEISTWLSQYGAQIVEKKTIRPGHSGPAIADKAASSPGDRALTLRIWLVKRNDEPKIATPDPLLLARRAT